MEPSTIEKISEDLEIGGVPSIGQVAEEKPESPDEKEERKEALKYFWEDYKMRQAHYWSSFNRYALVILTVLVVPYIKAGEIKPLGIWVYAFPVIGFILSLWATWLLGAEYQRLRAVKDKFEKLLTEKSPKYKLEYRNHSNDKILYRLFARSIGDITVSFFGIGLTSFAVIDLIAIYLLKIGR